MTKFILRERLICFLVIYCLIINIFFKRSGYGNRFITDECPEAIFTMCIQCIMGVFIQAFMVGIVFAKLARPIKRAQTLLFSRNAIICHRDGIPCLMFRVGDMRKSHIIEAHVRAQIIRKKVSKNDLFFKLYLTSIYFLLYMRGRGW